LKGLPDKFRRSTDWQTAPLRPLLIGLAVIAVLLFGVVGWGATAPLDSSISAEGTVTVESQRKTVQHPDGGVIEAVLVEDGERVEAGQPLLELDDTRAQASFKIRRRQLHGALARQARLRAERNGADEIDMPEALTTSDDPETRQVMQGQRELFKARRESLESRTEVLRNQIEQQRERIEGLQAEERARVEQVEIIEDLLSGLRRLAEQGTVARTEVLDKERQLATLKGESGSLRSQIAEARQSINELRLQIDQLQSDRQEEVAAQLEETNAQVADLRQRLVAARQTLRRTTIRAPVAGEVYGLRVHTIGGVVEAGAEILYIVPRDDELIITGRVSPRDIEAIERGLTTKVRFTGLNLRETPLVDGELIYISPDAQTAEGDGASYYEVRVRIHPDELDKLGEVRLQPGMPASMMIQTGSRTMLGYMLEPIQALLERSFNEK